MAINDTMLRTPMRDKGKFSSRFSEWVYNSCNHQFFLMDADVIIYKVETKILRYFEYKHENEGLSDGQKTMLPVLKDMIFHAVRGKIVAEGSGVYIIRGSIPFRDGATVENVMTRKSAYMTTEQLKRLVSGETTV